MLCLIYMHDAQGKGECIDIWQGTTACVITNNCYTSGIYPKHLPKPEGNCSTGICIYVVPDADCDIVEDHFNVS